MRKINKNELKIKLHFIASCIVFRLLLEVSYSYIVSQEFGYDGFNFNFSIINYLISWLLFLSFFVMVNYRLTKTSDYFFVTAQLGVIGPLLVMYGLDYERSVYPVLTTIVSLSFVYFISQAKLVSFKKIRTVKNGKMVAVLICCLFVVFLVAWYLVSGVSLNFNLFKVYEFRAENAKASSVGLLAYTNSWTYQVMNVALFAICLMYRKYFFAVVVLLVQVFFFAASTHKSVLFYPLMIFGVWLFFSKTNKLVFVPIIFSFVILITLITYYIYGDIFSTSLFSRRVFFVPANLTFAYFDFFDSNPRVYWSNSILSPLLDYPYNEGVPFVIGSYLGFEGMGANNGFVSSGYGHAGLTGVMAYSFLIGLILRFLNELSKQSVPLWFSVALVLIPLRNVLISSDLLTVLLTHGFLVAILILYLYRSKKHELL